MVVLLAFALAACASREATQNLPSGAKLPVAAQTPNSTALAVYLPSNYRTSRIFIGNAWVLPGKALEDSVSAVAQQFFTQSFLAAPTSLRPYGLLLSIQPEWKIVNRDVRMTMSYRVFAKDGLPLLQGQQSYSTAIGDIRTSDGFYNAALHTTQLVVIDVLARLQPNAAKYPAVNRLADADARHYVNHDKPVVTGTGFFINTSGQVVTAAHVLHDCAAIEVRRDDTVFNTRLMTSSALLDLAVMETSARMVTPLPLRRNEEITLGEPVVNVGFPLQSILGTSPSLTRGNISSRGALAGAIGEFQFSAPIQPGSSGGPVVSDGGELLGITLATLNPAPLIAKGILPQNINFALDARYAAMFLRRSGIAFTEVSPNPNDNQEVGNRAALAAVVSVACYQ